MARRIIKSDHQHKEPDMIKIAKKTQERIQSGLKQYQSIVTGIKNRDVSEADTVTVIKDMLADIFGFDKYLELTSEQQIRGTFCDLAVKIDSKIRLLIEVKAAGIALNDSHLRQAVNYGANEGIEWIVLSNAVEWKLYRIKFAQPIDFEEVANFNITTINTRNEEDIRKLFLLTRESITSDAMDAFHQHTQLLNKFTIAQMITTEPVVSAIRKELRKLFPDLKAEQDQIADIIANEVLKREVLEGDKVKDAQQRIKKASAKNAKTAEKKPVKQETNSPTTSE
jgi:hypothetical protein